MFYTRKYKSLCRCGCWHPENWASRNIVDGCICPLMCLEYIPSDNLEYLELEYEKRLVL
jgi:hypothetical protein